MPFLYVYWGTEDRRDTNNGSKLAHVDYSLSSAF